jgi:hypothetical protein
MHVHWPPGHHVIREMCDHIMMRDEGIMFLKLCLNFIHMHLALVPASSDLYFQKVFSIFSTIIFHLTISVCRIIFISFLAWMQSCQ